MSRGLGYIERKILATLSRSQETTSTDRRGSLAISKGKPFSSRELAQKIWGKRGQAGWKPALAQRKACVRAMHSIAAKFPEQFELSGGKGRETLVIYNICRVIFMQRLQAPLRGAKIRHRR
jgi:hypothetical protein